MCVDFFRAAGVQGEHANVFQTEGLTYLQQVLVNVRAEFGGNQEFVAEFAQKRTSHRPGACVREIDFACRAKGKDVVGQIIIRELLNDLADADSTFAEWSKQQMS